MQRDPAVQLQRLREGLAERGFLTGRNPDGVDQTVDTALFVIDEMRAAATSENVAMSDDLDVLGPRAASVIRVRARIDALQADLRGFFPEAWEYESACEHLQAARDELNGVLELIGRHEVEPRDDDEAHDPSAQTALKRETPA